MVSVGVQNETLPTKSRKKGRTKTMILMDASNQTGKERGEREEMGRGRRWGEGEREGGGLREGREKG